jgi:hypothetical protein
MIYAANFKTNHTRATTKAYIEALKEKLIAKKPEDKIYIFPPATALDSYAGDFTIGTQNAYPAQNGAYTGEIGVEQLTEFGIETILIGHSERREHMKEDQQTVAEKGNQRGFLLLDRSDPLSDLWFNKPEESKTEFSYDLKEPVTIPAGSTLDIPIEF